MTYHLFTFGCQMNVRDSNWLSAMLENEGYSEASAEKARIIIINTCSVREKPEKKVSSLINQIEGTRRHDPNVLIAVTGCVAQQLGKRLFDLGKKVRLVAGTDALIQIVPLLKKLSADPDLKICETAFLPHYPERAPVPETWPHASAMVNIMQGCDNFCAYCIVPYTRGRQKSRLKKEIISECLKFLNQGISEITLLGQNVNAWGKDNREGTFPDLLEEIARLDGLKRLHFTTPHPADLDDKSILAFSRLKNLCPRLHLPLQSGSDRILAKMGRRYCRKDYLQLIDKLRETRPDLALSTDLIVGFPGETEEDFEDTLEMMRKCRFMSSFSFCYSDRAGTRAFRMNDKISQEIKHERLWRLQTLQDQLDKDWLDKRVGSDTEILIEGLAYKSNARNPQWQGRDPYGAVVNASLEDGKAGQYRRVHIYEAGKHSLKGKEII